MVDSTRAVGNQAESLACSYLTALGYEILERNFTIFGGEIDIITEQDNVLVFVEVKARYSHQYGLPEEAITEHKIRALQRAINVYLQQRQLHHLLCRVDLVAIDFTLSVSKPEIKLITNIIESL